MKFFNFLFTVLLVSAFTSCDATKNLTSNTPAATTAPSTSVTSRQAPSKPTMTKPKRPTVKKPTTPSMDTDVASKVKKPTKPNVRKPKKPGVKKPGMASKAKNPMKGKAADLSAPKKPAMSGSMGNSATPGTIKWEAANTRYSAAGTFKKWRMTDVKMIGDDLNTLTAKLEIDLASIWEVSPKLTNHLKADDYFGVEEHQLATIEVTKVTASPGANVADLVLKMRGKEQSMKGTFKVTSMKPLTIAGSTMVDRSIFGIGTENTSVPNKIKVTFDTVIPR